MKFDELNLHILIEKENNIFSAICLELDVASQGATLKETKKIYERRLNFTSRMSWQQGMRKNFIPRPAPVEEWIKYFEVEARKLKNILQGPTGKLRLHEAVYA